MSQMVQSPPFKRDAHDLEEDEDSKKQVRREGRDEARREEDERELGARVWNQWTALNCDHRRTTYSE